MQLTLSEQENVALGNNHHPSTFRSILESRGTGRILKQNIVFVNKDDGEICRINVYGNA